MTSDKQFLRRTFELAIKGQGHVEPNPLVGAVVVKNNRIVGEGYHKFYGGPHAEVYALRKAGIKAKGATLYVNLEPCCHYGKTPPCTDLIIKSGIRRVVAAVQDPNPLVHGKGFRTLRAASIAVTTGLLSEEAKELNAPFLKVQATGLPYVIAKWAMTLDGKIATFTGDSKWISSETSRHYVKGLRTKVQAIVIGIETALQDNPRLLSANPQSHGPVRVVLDSQARLPLSSHLVKTARLVHTVVFARQSASQGKIARLEKANCNVVCLKDFTLRNVLRTLGRLGCSTVLIEGGGEVHASAFEAGLVDEILAFISPKIVGGRDAKTPIEGKGIATMARALHLSDYEVFVMGNDIVIHGSIRD